MTASYHIKVVNNNTENTRYLLFCDPPKASNNIGKAWVNIYAQTPGVAAKGGSTNVKIDNTNYAVCGLGEEPLGPGVSVSTAQSMPVALGPDTYGKVTMGIEDDGLMFEGDPEKTSTVGGYDMVSKLWTNAKYPTAFCGYGKIQPNKVPTTIIPVATWAAKSGETYKVYPKIIYYISTGSYTPGEIVDRGTFGQVATVDFSGRDETYATVTQTKEGTYLRTEYSYNP